MYSTAPAQEQGARLPARRHRRLDFSQNSGQQLTFCFVEVSKIEEIYFTAVLCDDFFCECQNDLHHPARAGRQLGKSRCQP